MYPDSTALVVRDQEVLEPGEKTLEELAREANAEHREMVNNITSALNHALACGKALLAAREKVGLRTGYSGEGWTIWLSENVDIGFTLASQLMRAAFHADKIPQKAFEPYIDARGHKQQPTFKRVLPYLSGLALPPIGDSNYGRRIPEETREEARSLYKQGVPFKEIANLLGVSDGSVRNICLPGRQKKNQNLQTRKRAKLKRAQLMVAESDLQKRRLNAARAYGIDQHYSSLRKLEQRLQVFVDAEKDQEIRLHLRFALSALHKAEDEIGLALRVPRIEGDRRIAQRPNR